MAFLGSSLNRVSSTLNAIILDKSHPRWPVPTTVINILYGQVAVVLPPHSALNGHDSQITSCKDFPGIKELLAGALIQSTPEQQPSPHSRFMHVTRTGDKRSRPESSILLDQNWKSACSPGNIFQSHLFNRSNTFFNFWQLHYISFVGEELNLSHYSCVPNLEWKPALWQNIIHFSYIPRKQLDSHHKILKPNIAVGSFWVSRLGVAPSMSNMHWKRYVFKARQGVNWYTVIFSLKTFEQF